MRFHVALLAFVQLQGISGVQIQKGKITLHTHHAQMDADGAILVKHNAQMDAEGAMLEQTRQIDADTAQAQLDSLALLLKTKDEWLSAAEETFKAKAAQLAFKDDPLLLEIEAMQDQLSALAGQLKVQRERLEHTAEMRSLAQVGLARDHVHYRHIMAQVQHLKTKEEEIRILEAKLEVKHEQLLKFAGNGGAGDVLAQEQMEDQHLKTQEDQHLKTQEEELKMVRAKLEAKRQQLLNTAGKHVAGETQSERNDSVHQLETKEKDLDVLTAQLEVKRKELVLKKNKLKAEDTQLKAKDEKLDAQAEMGSIGA